jgi:uncharacterized integral membrane protein (TIGR00698 family)
MIFSRGNIRNSLNGILFVVLFSVAAVQIASIGIVKQLGFSPLIIGILIGMVYANTLRSHSPKEWGPGITFCAKTVLRTAVVLYGFRVTFQQIGSVGIQGLTLSVIIVATTFSLGALIGQKVFGLDRDTALLTAAGSSVCGAAAVLATEPVLKAEAYKSSIAVSTVVLFGTTSMFLYPILFRTGIIPFDQTSFGLYTGSTIHEVAQVVGAAAAVGPEATRVAVIVKMTRVMLLAPLLLILGIILSASAAGKKNGSGGIKIVIPWFAVLFIVASGVNSTGILSSGIVSGISVFDTFLLTMAMTALGLETSAKKFKQAGLKPFLLALVLYVWLVVGGYFITKAVVTLL